MKKLDHHDNNVEHDDMVELGAASVETRGPVPPTIEEVFAYQLQSGISKD